jgi:Plant ATP synthase F0
MMPQFDFYSFNEQILITSIAMLSFYFFFTVNFLPLGFKSLRSRQKFLDLYLTPQVFNKVKESKLKSSF